MKAYTDYPFDFLGDPLHVQAPVRECEVLSYDGDKYCIIIVGGVETEVKSGYLYSKRGRFGKVPVINIKDLPIK